MKNLKLYRLVRYIATYHFLSSFVVFFLVEMNGVSGRPDVRTKLLLQNIRTHLAQKADEIIKEKECESGLSLCKSLKNKEEEEEEVKSEEIPPPPKFLRGQHKPLITVRSKDVVQTFTPKAHKSHHRKFQKPGEKEPHLKFLHSPDTEPALKPNNDSEEEASEEIIEKPKKKRELPKESIKSEQKQRDNTEGKVLKPKKKYVKEEAAFENVGKIVKKKEKLVEDKSDTGVDKSSIKDIKKVDKPLMKDIKRVEKPLVKAESKNKGKAKTNLEPEQKDEQRFLTEEVILFPNFVFVLDSENFQRSTCGKHSQIYLKQLKKYETWALMMYDASAKLSSGVLQGNTNQYGDFDECLSVNAVFKKSKKAPKNSSGIKGKFCLANVDMMTNSDSRGLQLIQQRGESLGFIKSTIHDPGHFIPRFSTMNWGLCVPSSCSAEDVEKYLKSQLEPFSNASGLKYEVEVDEDNCVVKDDLKFKWRPETLMTILFYLIVMSISLYATYSDVKCPKEKLERETQEPVKSIAEESKENGQELSLKGKGKRIIMAFSIKKNFGKLLSDENKGNIECINGIRSIFTVLLYLAHKTIPLAMTPFTNRVALTKISNHPATVLFRSSIVYTDSFLLISGILTAYSLAKDLEERRETSWMRKAIARFIRLTPPLLAVVLFYAFIWDQLGSGPVWNLIVKKNSFLCQKYFWRNTLYVQNFFHFEEMCAPQTHQLALDMQLSLFAPLFVYLMHTYGKVGVGILQAFFILSSILRYTTTSNNNLSVVVYHGMTVTQLYKTANLLYAKAFHRASPYILGTVVGFHLHKFENKIQIPKAIAALGWLTAGVFGYYSLVSPTQSASRGYQYNVQEASEYAALSPVAWAFALSWVIAACHLGLGGKLNEFLRQRIFLVFSRISYSVYLTQFLIFFYKIGVQRIPEMFTFAGSFDVIEFITVIGLSVVVTLFFDIPAMEIKKIIFDGRTGKPPPEELHDESESFGKEEESGSEVVSLEESQEITEELADSVEDEEREDIAEDVDMQENPDEEEAPEDADVPEESDENGEEVADDDVIEAVFEIRPLRRSSRMHFSDEPDDKECFQDDPKTEDDIN